MIYIKKNVKNYYVEFPNKLEEEQFNNIGTTYEDFIKNKWILLSDEQIQFHEENPYASVKEVLAMELTPRPEPVVYERTLEDAKQEMISQIDSYDYSEEINSFSINGEINTWFTPEQRANYKNSIDSAKILGIDILQFFVENQILDISVEQAEEMLAMIQMYADTCYIVTKNHKLNVETLETIEEVDDYDYKVGYPDKLNFKL